MIDAVGWAATAIFLASYSCNDARKLRLMQAGAALVWVSYGAMLHAIPIIVANLLVAGVAAYSAVQGLRRGRAAGTTGEAITPAAAADLSRIS
jgi:Bacterial inner membrane protein